MSDYVHALIGRPDLMGTYQYTGGLPATGAGHEGSSMAMYPSGAGVGAGVTTSFSGGVSLGQTSLSMVAGGVMLLFLLYVWTRGRQA